MPACMPPPPKPTHPRGTPAGTGPHPAGPRPLPVCRPGLPLLRVCWAVPQQQPRLLHGQRLGRHHLPKVLRPRVRRHEVRVEHTRLPAGVWRPRGPPVRGSCRRAWQERGGAAQAAAGRTCVSTPGSPQPLPFSWFRIAGLPGSASQRSTAVAHDEPIHHMHAIHVPEPAKRPAHRGFQHPPHVDPHPTSLSGQRTRSLLAECSMRPHGVVNCAIVLRRAQARLPF